MKTVNPYLLHVPLEPIVGLADDDEAIASYQHLNDADLSQLREFIKDELVPEFLAKPASTRARVQDAYRYYLTKEDSKWDRVFYSQLPPFEGPANIREFFVVLYDELFGHDSYLIEDVSEWIVVPDMNET